MTSPNGLTKTKPEEKAAPNSTNEKDEFSPKFPLKSQITFTNEDDKGTPSP